MNDEKDGNNLGKNPEKFERILIILTKKGFACGYM